MVELPVEVGSASRDYQVGELGIKGLKFALGGARCYPSRENVSSFFFVILSEVEGSLIFSGWYQVGRIDRDPSTGPG